MRLKKKSAIAISFAVGTMLFATTALAEVAAKSGYEQFKDSLKFTADSFTEKLSSYTTDISFEFKDNDTVISSESSIGKFDVSKQAQEYNTTSLYGGNKTEGYSYSDKKSNISYNKDQDTYYVTEYTNENDIKVFSNPFKEKSAGDIEKIADAVVGDLKDYVVVTQNPDGSKEMSGSLSEAQIPALINAVVSFQFKSSFSNGQFNGNAMPAVSKDIFIKEIKGKVLVDKDGLIQSILGTGVLSGKDEAGKEHNLTFQLLAKVSNINSTVVNKPDLTGKTIQTNTQENGGNKLANPSMYIGKYKNDIVIQKDGKFEKIGERTVEIKSIDDKTISGTYSEEYKKDYESYTSNAKNFEFNATYNDPYNATFNSTTSSGKSIQGNVSVPPISTDIYFNINEAMSGNMQNSGQYHRVFE